MGSKNRSRKNLSRNKENIDIENDDIVNQENENIEDSQCTSYLTTSTGSLVSNDTNSETVGSSGPVLIQDVHLIDKMAHFDRERIPERVVHATGIKLLLHRGRSWQRISYFFLAPIKLISNV